MAKWLEKEVIFTVGGTPPIEEWQSARCSACGKYHTTPYMYYFDEYAYCPNCGQAMDGKDEPQTFDKPPKCLGCFYSDLDKAFHPCASCVDFGEYIGEVSGKDESRIDCKTCRHNKSGWYEKGSLSCGRCCSDNFEFYEPKDEPQERSK